MVAATTYPGTTIPTLEPDTLRELVLSELVVDGELCCSWGTARVGINLRARCITITHITPKAGMADELQHQFYQTIIAALKEAARERRCHIATLALTPQEIDIYAAAAFGVMNSNRTRRVWRAGGNAHR